MVHFVGAGCGAPDLITLRGHRLLQQADQIIYAGSLVNPALLEAAKPGCVIRNSAQMTLEQVLESIREAEAIGQTTVRLHTGDPSLYGAVREQIDALQSEGISFDITPGVSAFSGAAAALGHLGGAEYTLPGVSQTLIVTRMAGRTPVPESESIERLAAHRAYPADTPAAIVYKASWPDEKTILCTVGQLPVCAQEHGIQKTALILIGEYLRGTSSHYERSKLYDPSFSTGFREASQ